MAASRVTAGVLLLCVIVILGWETVDVSASTRAQDVSALNELASTWSAAKRLNWKGDPCDNQWIGVACANTNSGTTVTSLSLQDNNLRGTLPSTIGSLTNLVNLDLSRNYLSGELPTQLGELVNLNYLSLQWCNFTGKIPTSLSNLINLTFLGLNGNQLSGTIPPSFGLLTNLTWLDISTNQLSGTIPVSSDAGSNGIGLDNMTSVRHFHFNNNLLSGSVPPEIFTPAALIHIIFDNNKLENTLPTTAIANAQNLTILRLDSNQLSGTLPDELDTLANLLNLNLQNNLFSGQLPNLSSLVSLQLLDVSNNKLAAQQFPTWVSALPSLQTLNLGHNQIQGPIDDNVFSISPLQSLNVSNNQVSGTLSFPPQSASGLIWIDVSDNDITGFSGQPVSSNGQPIPGLMIRIAGNPLCSNPYLSSQDLQCGSDFLKDFWTAPTNGSCASVDCKSNRVLDHKTCTCAYPLQVSIILTGSTFSNLTNDFASDLEAEIASKISIGGFNVTLDPGQVVINTGETTEYDRYQLDMLFFPLAGDTLSSYENSEIVLIFNQRRVSLSVGPFQVPFGPYTGSKSSSPLSAGAIAGIVIGALALVLVVVGYAVLQKIRADRAVASHPFASWGAGGAEFGEAPKLKGARWFPLAELKLATNDWSKQNEIGHGGYGKVYKGVLKSGDIVAIKRAQEGSMQGAAEFKNEIELLSRVHHRNLVGLVGFCYENGEQALIYEFMSNGTIREHLQGEAYPPLKWQERLDIALGSARGIAYLHDHANPPIIHRDIKTSNILLNDRQAAKVADFGLSKLAPEEGEMRVYSENVKGTMGYLDPEYYTTFKLTDKSDVYAFGIVLLEFLTARPPIVNGRSVVHEVRGALDRGGLANLRPLLDPALHDLPDAELQDFLNVALKCVEESSENRDRIGEVVKQLEGLGAHSHPNVDVQNLDVGLGGQKAQGKLEDDDGLYQSPPAAKKDETNANHPNFQYSGNSNMMRSTYKTVTSRLRAPLAARRPFSPLSQSVDLQ